jgi:transposase InsO family protein
MGRLGLKARYPKRFKVTTDSNHNEAISPNSLDRQFDVVAPNQVWTTDITYIWTLEGWLYLAVVIDLFSRQVVGWAIADHMRTALCVSALQMAFWRRKPEPGLLHHSDRGSQYASHEYRKHLSIMKMEQSMSRKGNCWDTQFRMPLNVWPNPTRAGIGVITFELTCRLVTGVPRSSPGPSLVA